MAWPEPLFPFLLVNIGSGVSVLRVDGIDPPPSRAEGSGRSLSTTAEGRSLSSDAAAESPPAHAQRPHGRGRGSNAGVDVLASVWVVVIRLMQSIGNLKQSPLTLLYQNPAGGLCALPVLCEGEA